MSDLPLFVLYGSATGNSEFIAKDLASKYEKNLPHPFTKVICCEGNGFKKKCLPIWETPPQNPCHKYGVVVVISTTGNGDAPENASRFVRYVKRKPTIEAKPMRHVAFSVLALGDSNYDQFCATGALVDKKFAECGGERARKLGMADEATGLEEVVEEYVENVISLLVKACDKQASASTSTSAAIDVDVAAPVASPKKVASAEVEKEEEKKAENPLHESKSNVPVTVRSSKPDMERRNVPKVSPIVSSKPSTTNVETVIAPTKISEVGMPKEKSGNGDKIDSFIDVLSISGLSIVHQLIKTLDESKTDETPTATIPKVPSTSLPTIGSSLSSCKLLPADYVETRTSTERELSDAMTASSASSSNIHYTLKNPYESTILNARYLTKTPIDGAKEATDILYKNDNVDKTIANDGEAMLLLSAMKQFENKFPLTTSNITGKEVTDDECIRNGKRVVEMTLSLPDDFTLEYQPGDSIGLISSNSSPASQFILSLLQEKHQISKSQLLSVNDGDATTVEHIVCDYIDLCTPIKNKKILASFANYASDSEEAAALNLLSSTDTLGQQLFQTFITEQRITVVDIMKLFPSCQETISIDGLLAILPQIPPRYYSICSSPLGTEISTSLSVAFSVVDYMTPKLNLVGEPQRRMAGLTTTYLETICSQFLDTSDKTTSSNSISKNDIPKIKIFPKAADEFRLPSDLSIPMILIGPGTGIAPFIGFVEHRRAQRMSKETTTATKSISQGTWRGGFDIEEEESAMANCTLNKKKYGDIDLYFGCRHSDHDWLYEDEMKLLKDQGIISALNVAFSRDDANSKCYVQDKIKDNAKHIGEMIAHDNASIYICGDGNSMAKDVQVALQSALDEYYASHVVPDSDKPRQSVATLKAEKRLLLDIWS